MSNLYRRFASILSNEPRDKGRVIAVHSDSVTVELVTGDHRRVRGTAAIDDHVFIRGARIEGPAPALNGLTQEI